MSSEEIIFLIFLAILTMVIFVPYHYMKLGEQMKNDEENDPNNGDKKTPKGDE